VLTRHLISILIFSFCLVNLANAGEVNNTPKDIDFPYSDEDFSPCGVAKSDEEMAAASEPKPADTNEITYVSGGICAEEVNFMKGIARHFPLEVVLVQEHEGREIYIADVSVSLQNAKQKQVLDVVTDGPFIFVNLPDGKYTVTASYHGISQTKSVNIAQKKHSRIVFLWKDEAELTQ
jgi:hypothetical protein